MTAIEYSVAVGFADAGSPVAALARVRATRVLANAATGCKVLAFVDRRYLALTLSRKRAYFPAPFLPLGDLVEQIPV